MIAPIIFLNIFPTIRTRALFRRLRNQRPTRLLLALLDALIRPVIVLAARLALVPTHVVLGAVALVARHAGEFVGGGRCVVDVPRFTSLGYAPGEARNGFKGCARAEFVVSRKGGEG